MRIAWPWRCVLPLRGALPMLLSIAALAHAAAPEPYAGFPTTPPLLAPPPSTSEYSDERELARSPDGRYVAWSVRPERERHSVALELREARNGKVRTSIEHGLDSANWTNFARLGTKIPILVYFQPGNDCGPGTKHIDGVLDAKFSPDSKRLAVLLENRLRIFEVPSGRRCGSNTVRFSSEGSLKYSADGKRLSLDTQRRHTTSMVVDGRTGATISRKTSD